MVIKSGRGVVYLTRPQKLFSSSYHPQKTNLSFHLPPAPRIRGSKRAQAHQNVRQFPQYSQFLLKYIEKKNLTFAPKAVTITLWSLKVGIDLLCG